MSNLAISQIPTWLDSWIFGTTYVGPVTSPINLAQAYNQVVQVDSIAGTFQVAAPTGMNINDVITLTDIGNSVVSYNVTFSSVAGNYPLQNPNTMAISVGPSSYPFGSHESNGSSLTWQLVQDPNLGIYLKSVQTATYSGGGGSGGPTLLTTIYTTPGSPLTRSASWMRQPVDTLAAAVTVTAPTSAALGDQLDFLDAGRSWGVTGRPSHSTADRISSRILSTKAQLSQPRIQPRLDSAT